MIEVESYMAWLGMVDPWGSRCSIAPMPEPATPSPTKGRVVLYVVPAGPTDGETRPATVVDAKGHVADLFVLFKPTDDPALASYQPRMGTAFVQGVSHSDSRQPGTWHWPPRV